SLIARAAEGSARDGLSVLDQALAHGGGKVKAADILSLLGLADRGRVYDLMDAVFAGKTADALSLLDTLHSDGADPLQIIGDMSEGVHAASRIKAAGGDAVPALSSNERSRAAAIAERLSVAALARAWQMLLKGLDEVARAPRGISAAEMLLIRMCHASGLPSPEDIVQHFARAPAAETNAELKKYESAPHGGVPDSSAGRMSLPPAIGETPMPQPRETETSAVTAPQTRTASLKPDLASFADIVRFVAEKRDLILKIALEDTCELVRFKPGHIELHLLDAAPKDLANELGRKLKYWTGDRWMISLTDKRGERPLGEIRREREARLLEQTKRHPTVKSIIQHFPEAEILGVREVDDPKKD
ncbi:MAG: DNA polymerase III subunit gamma/tau, partial [Hyphomicrobiales bacterium]|nr:DNA polymerase III subunit gamma/tau [Hyphomicrobiales bacterium]